MSPALTPVGVLAAGTGAWLIYSALTGQSPMAELRAALTTGTIPAGVRRALTSSPAPAADSSTARGRGGAGPSDGSGASSRVAPELVSIGQGSHRLTPQAAAAFRHAETLYGRQIPVTDSYRSYERQMADHKRDPDRFASPDGSAHPMGLAVDINLPALGITRGVRGDPAYEKLWSAMTRAGWQTYSDGKPGSHTWHWSYGIRR